jgi:hypothetical protein
MRRDCPGHGYCGDWPLDGTVDAAEIEGDKQTPTDGGCNASLSLELVWDA